MIKLIAVLCALAVSACSTLPDPVAAQAASPAGDPVPTIDVSATATVRGVPDVAVIQLAVETMAGSAAEASEENADRMEAVLRAVRGLDVPSSHIRTQRLELHPRYERRREEQTELVGYQAINQVTVRVEDVSLVGAIVDAAVRAGANRVSGIHFELSDPDTHYHQALRDAVAKARAEAEVMASALGRRLGEPLHVSTGGAQPMPPRYRVETMEMARTADMAPPVEPGEVEVRATVSITWRLGS